MPQQVEVTQVVYSSEGELLDLSTPYFFSVPILKEHFLRILMSNPSLEQGLKYSYTRMVTIPDEMVEQLQDPEKGIRDILPYICQ